MATVNTQHEQYKRMAPEWEKCRAAAEGQSTVKAKGELFLPRLKDQSDADYNSYRLRASFFNATWRTIAALSGIMFNEEPEVEVGAATEPLLEDVTLSGVSLQIFAQEATIDVLTTGRVGILADFPSTNSDGMTIAQAQSLNLRPTLQKYPAESIINWKITTINNVKQLTLIVLRECVEIAVNEFQSKSETRYRVLDLINGEYRQRLFKVNSKDEDEQIGADVFPVMNNARMGEIPFYFIGVGDTTSEVDYPPMIDLVEINLSHYRLNADYNNGLHFTGLPTAIVTGYTPQSEGEKLYIGSSAAWILPDPQASAKFLEFTGQGLQAIEKALDRLEQQMAILGARLLTSEKKDTETAQTAQIHRAGESSILSAVSQTISIGLTRALTTFAQWAGDKTEVSIELNDDFLPETIDSQMLTALIAAWQTGAISKEVLFENLRAGQITGDTDFEEMEAQIESAGMGAATPAKAAVPATKMRAGDMNMTIEEIAAMRGASDGSGD